MANSCSGVNGWCQIDKTAFIIIGEEHTRESLVFFSTSKFYFSGSGSKKPGCHLRFRHSFYNHTAKVCHACYNRLRHLQCTHKFILSVDTAVLVANSMVNRKLDYYNSPLFGVKKPFLINFRNFKML